MKIKREAQVNDYLTEALLQLMKKKPYREITITELCEKAGVTRMSFYRNFADKEDILKKWISAVTADFLTDSGISYKNDSTRTYFTKLFTHMQNYTDICISLHQAGLMHLVKDEFDNVFLTLHRDEYDDYKSFFLAGGVYNIFLMWLMRGCRETPAELAEKLTNLLEK